MVLEWDPIELATADLISLSLYRNGNKVGSIPRPLAMHSTKISGLAVDTEYDFHLVLRTTAGTWPSEHVRVRTHKMTDLSGITITPGILQPPSLREQLARAVERIGARIVDGVRIDTTHFVTTEGRGLAWEKAVEMNIPVVRPEWVAACEQSGRILGVTKFYLDALQPGPGMPLSPPPQQQTAPAAQPQVQKDLPPQPQASPQQPQHQQQPGPATAAESTTDDGDSDEDDEKTKTQPPDSAKSPAGMMDEQKMRLDDREGHKLAVRPAPAKVESDDEDDEEEEGARGKGKGREEGLDKPTASPGDASSFQDVAL